MAGLARIEHMVTKFRRAVQALDYRLIAECIHEFELVGKLDERQIYRLALAAEPGLAFDAWQDIVRAARERHSS